MSNRIKPSQAISPDDARAAARELREAIQDGQALLRQLRAEHEQIKSMHETAVEEFNVLMTAMKEHIQEQDKLQLAIIAQETGRIREIYAQALGHASPQELMEGLARQVTPAVTAAVVDAVDEALPRIVVSELERLATTGRRKAGRVTIEVEAARLIQPSFNTPMTEAVLKRLGGLADAITKGKS